MNGKTYQIGELAKLAGVTIRTIRYYISQGLLPSPTSSGQFDRYDDSYLHRLELIRRLKAEYLPLDKIRTLLTSMSNETILDELSHPVHIPSAPSSARDYVRSVLYPSEPVTLNKRLANRVTELKESSGAIVQNGESTNFNHLSVSRDRTTLFDQEKSEVWLRYRIHPDIELHIREQPAYPHVKDRLPKLLIELRRLCYLLELDEKEPENE